MRYSRLQASTDLAAAGSQDNKTPLPPDLRPVQDHFESICFPSRPTLSELDDSSFRYSISIGSLAGLSLDIYLVSKKKKKTKTGFHHSRPTYVEDNDEFRGFKVAGGYFEICPRGDSIYLQITTCFYRLARH